MTDKEKAAQTVIWAWIGEDDATPPTEPGVIGIKRGATMLNPDMPLVSIRPGQLQQEYIRTQMQLLAQLTGKRRFLARYRFDGFVEIAPTAEAPQTAKRRGRATVKGMSRKTQYQLRDEWIARLKREGRYFGNLKLSDPDVEHAIRNAFQAGYEARARQGYRAKCIAFQDHRKP